MKELIFAAIKKFIHGISAFAVQSNNNFKFQGNKNEVIKVMLDSIIQSKLQEKNSLIAELKSTKAEASQVTRELDKLQHENQVYIKKINAMKAFQQFLINNISR